MRCDVNVSVRPEGQQELGTKVEVKNMNSFSAMQKAIDFEIDRQASCMPCSTSSSAWRLVTFKRAKTLSLPH